MNIKHDSTAKEHKQQGTPKHVYSFTKTNSVKVDYFISVAKNN